MSRLLVALALACLSLATWAAEKPLPVRVTNSSLEVREAAPVFVRFGAVVFSRDAFDSTRTRVLPVTQHIVIRDVHVETTGIRDVAGCHIQIDKRVAGQPDAVLFSVFHPELDASTVRTDQATQQRLADGVELNPGDEIVVTGVQNTDTEMPSPGPNPFCSSTVQLFGAVLE